MSAAEPVPGTAPAVDEDRLRAVVVRLARPHPSGGRVVERAAVLAEGAASGAILEWISAHGGAPEAAGPVRAPSQGLHGARTSGRAEPTRRYVLPPGALG